ncbi:MAG: SCP-2 sterol transfer family protein [Gammaproteobacteria bacterium]|nr:SCP-2 sterol transfer family protein [Gammaproteobacteria bacterium]
MADMFSDEWMNSFKDQWNAEPELSDALAKINFNSVIAYGFDGEDTPRGVLTVENGKATKAGPYTGNEELSWDLRATFDNWNKWMAKPPGMMGLGMAYTSRKLKFNVGDYGAMVKDPRMAGPFIKSFSVMGRA